MQTTTREKAIVEATINVDVNEGVCVDSELVSVLLSPLDSSSNSCSSQKNDAVAPASGVDDEVLSSILIIVQM